VLFQWSEQQTEIHALISYFGREHRYHKSSFLYYFYLQQQDPVVYFFMYLCVYKLHFCDKNFPSTIGVGLTHGLLLLLLLFENYILKKNLIL
jgi:hypothetical protein